MFNPLIDNLDDLSIEQLNNKMSELNKRITFAHQTGNYPLLVQLQNIYSVYEMQFKDKIQQQNNSLVKPKSLQKPTHEEPLSWSFKDSELAQSQR